MQPRFELGEHVRVIHRHSRTGFWRDKEAIVVAMEANGAEWTYHVRLPEPARYGHVTIQDGWFSEDDLAPLEAREGAQG